MIWGLFVTVFEIVTVHFFSLLVLKKKIYNTLFCNFGSWKLVSHAQVAGEPQEYKSFLSIINRELLKNIRNFLL